MAKPRPVKAPPTAAESTKLNPSDTDAPPAAGADGEPVFAKSKHKGDLGLLGPYRVLKKIGFGGMGAVYLGFEETLQRNVALKVMLPKIAVNKAARDRFLREARASAAVEHPHVVTVFSVGEHNGLPFLAMQYLQGAPLDKYLAKKSAPSLAQILRVGRETAEGLAAAHAKGLVHRDIKPANLWLEAPHGRIKILDFGLAKPTHDDDEASAELTQLGAVVGTPAYMAPEQARADAIDHRTDLYSLGAVLYRLCTGKQPFSGANVMAVLTALATDKPKPVRETNPEVPQPLADFILKLLEKEPAKRPQTAMDVANAFKSFEKTLQGSGTQPMAAATTVTTPQLPPPEAPASAPPMPQHQAPAFAPPMPMMPQPPGYPPQFHPPYPPAYPPQYPAHHPANMSVTAQDDAFAHFGEEPADGPASATKRSGTGLAHAAAKRSGTGSAIKMPADKQSLPKAVWIGIGIGAIVLVGGVLALVFGGSNKPAEVKNDAPPVTPKKDTSGKGKTSTPAVTPTANVVAKFSPLTEKFLAEVKDATPDQQKFLIEHEFARRHPGFEGSLATEVIGGQIVGVTFKSAHVTDLTPLKALPDLKSLNYSGTTNVEGPLTNLAPLAGMKLETLSLVGHPNLNDLKPLKDLPLTKLNLGYSDVSDLTPLAGKSFTSLNLNHCRSLADLKPLESCSIGTLLLLGTAVTDLSPLVEVNLKSLTFNADVLKDLTPLVRAPLEKVYWEPVTAKLPPTLLAPLRNKTTLVEIQKIPAATHWIHIDGRQAATAKPAKTVKIADKEIFQLAKASDGKQYAVCGADLKIRTFDTVTHELLQVINAPALVYTVAYLPNSEMLVGRLTKSLQVWDSRAGVTVGDAIPLAGPSGSMAISPDGKMLYVGPWTDGIDKFRIHRFALPGLQAQTPLKGHNTSVTQMAFTRDSRFFATAGHNRRDTIYDLSTGEPAFKKDPGSAGESLGTAFTPDEQLLLHADSTDEVALIDWKNGIEKVNFRVMQATRVTFGPESKTILVGSRDGWLTVYDLTGKPLAYASSGSHVRNISLSPDKASIYTLHQDGKLRVWDAKELKTSP